MEKLIRLSLSLRFVMLIAAVGALVGSLIVYAAGLGHLAEAVGLIEVAHAVKKPEPVVLVLEAMDAFLFGIVLNIFAFGIAFGFVYRLPADLQATLPDWTRISGVGQLKQTLAEVVVVILIVSFAKQVVETDESLAWSDLVLPLAILLIAGAMALLRLVPDKSHH